MLQGILLLLGVILRGVISDYAPYGDCGSPNAKLVEAQFTPPCERHACILRRGEQITVLAKFLPKINSNIITVNAYQTEKFLNVETVMVQGENLCGKHNISCPLVANRMEYAFVTGTVPLNFPNHRTTFRLDFFADNGVRLFCSTCPIEVR